MHMSKVNTTFQATNLLEGRTLRQWRVAQALCWLTGFGIFVALIAYPRWGVVAFWNILIPLAPAIFVLATGVWRNICPLGTVSLLPRHWGISKSGRLPLQWQGRLHLAGVGLLLLIIPLRHIWLNTNGPATAGLLAFLALLAFACGYFFEWKSGWCSSLCPVHPVERLYGSKVLFSPPNAHCGQCHNCVIPCPDSTPGMNPSLAKMRRSQRIAGCLLIGGLPGYIWGWFHVPDFSNALESWRHLPEAYAWPLSGMAVTMALYGLINRYGSLIWKSLLPGVFAAAAVGCYYWYRIPSLLGFGLFPGDGMLLDLSTAVPFWSILILQLVSTAFFAWWIVWRRPDPAVWAVRPPFEKVTAKNPKHPENPAL